MKIDLTPNEAHIIISALYLAEGKRYDEMNYSAVKENHDLYIKKVREAKAFFQVKDKIATQITSSSQNDA